MSACWVLCDSWCGWRYVGFWDDSSANHDAPSNVYIRVISMTLWWPEKHLDEIRSVKWTWWWSFLVKLGNLCSAGPTRRVLWFVWSCQLQKLLLKNPRSWSLVWVLFPIKSSVQSYAIIRNTKHVLLLLWFPFTYFFLFLPVYGTQAPRQACLLLLVL